MREDNSTGSNMVPVVVSACLWVQSSANRKHREKTRKWNWQNDETEHCGPI